MTTSELIKQARLQLEAARRNEKKAFVPMGPGGPAAGGPPPGDPAAGGAPPGPPQDPAAMGAPPPMDPAAMGAPPADPAGGQAVTVGIQDLVQLFQMVSGGGAPGGAPPAGGAPPVPGAPAPAPGGAAPAGAPGADGKPKGKGAGKDEAVLGAISELKNSIDQLVAFLTGVQAATGGGDMGGGAPPGDPASMGAGVDPSMAPPAPTVPGAPPGMDPAAAAGGMPAAPPPGGMQVQASARSGRNDSKTLNRIMNNLSRR